MSHRQHDNRTSAAVMSVSQPQASVLVGGDIQYYSTPGRNALHQVANQKLAFSSIHNTIYSKCKIKTVTHKNLNNYISIN